MASTDGLQYERAAAQALVQIEHESNRRDAERYLQRRRADGIRFSTLLNDLNAVRDLAAFLGSKGFLEATEDDIIAFVNQRARTRVFRSKSKDGTFTETVREIRISDRTMDIRKVILRSFLQWLHGCEEGVYPECVRRLKTRTAKADQVITDRIISRSELARIMQAAPELRVKAIIAVLHESGLRAGELASLNIGNVEFDQHGAVLRMSKGTPGLKTGARAVRLLRNQSVPYLQSWIEEHPAKHDPGAPLFFSNSKRAPMSRLTSSSLWNIIRRAGDRAGLSRPIKTHDFRHTAATEKARLGLNEAEMRWYFGWSRTSDMPSHYTHLVAKDYETMLLERSGVAPTENQPAPVMFAPCPVCEHENAHTNVYCGQCRTPLKPQAEEDRLELQNEAMLAVVKEQVAQVLAQMAQARP